MDDLERFVRELVRVIKKTNPEHLRSPFQVSELYQKIIPYRSYKKRLELASSEDYDMVVLRLLSGERGYASVQPIEVQNHLALEAESVNPTPGLFREFAAATVQLNSSVVRSVLSEADLYAPPAPVESANTHDLPHPEATYDLPVERLSTASSGPVFEAVEPEPEVTDPIGEAALCLGCSRPFPSDRDVIYCPFCGIRVGLKSCSHCGSQIENSWSYCVTCGKPAPGD
ncbi:MAG: hypothetical protein AMS18_01860 [Gemmatimonas sp. SG8_17]|nr:MAG: hypothetical protein AMS18_01860 [Gemmatimonas sp. SG8_17]